MANKKETEVKGLQVIEKEVSPAVKKAEALVIESDDDLKGATELLSNLNKGLDRATEEKEKVTKPLNEALKAERARWKPFETMCEAAIDIVRKKMTAYQTEKTRHAQEEAARIAERVGEGKGKLKAETAVRKMEEIEQPLLNVSSKAGMVDFIDVKCFEVEDITKLPIDYIVADEVKIRAAMKAGQELPGVKYWVEQRPRNFR